MKNILVPTDLSDISEKGLKVAVEIAKRVHGKIYLVNFIKHPFGSTFTATGDVYTKYSDDENLFTVQLVRKHKADLDAIALKYSEPEVFNIHTAVYDEELKDGVDPFLRENDIDLVVMGTTGEQSVDETFTGNHVEQVVARASCPVLSVREDYRPKDLHHIVVGWNLDTQKDYTNAVAYINELSVALKARLDIVHVTKLDKDKEELSIKMRQFASNFGLSNYSLHIVEDDDVEEGLLNYAHKVQAGIIVMLSQAKSGMARLFTHSSSEEMSKESDIPVFTINLHNI